MDSKSVFSASVSDAPRSYVYRLQLELEEFGLRLPYHVAVFRDDLRCFVVVADLPSDRVTCRVNHELGEVLSQVLSTDLADWQGERIVLGMTSWLARRHDRSWRTIERIQIVDGSAERRGLLPQEICEPLIRLLEGSVPHHQTLIEA